MEPSSIDPHPSKLLVANRGEIARRIIRTARAMGIATVAVFSDADADAPYVRDADEAVRLAGTPPADTYLRVDRDRRRRRGAPAPTPSTPATGSSPRTPTSRGACADAGLDLRRAAARRRSRRWARSSRPRRSWQAAGVPVLPGVDGRAERRRRRSTALASASASRCWSRPSLGGGGRGMRVVARARRARRRGRGGRSARRRRRSATARVFLERYVERPRHVEVQVFGDTHGTVVHLFERECSIQRRHQKIIEEAPSPAVDERRCAGACADAAVAAGKASATSAPAPSSSCSTHDGEFCFLEMNTRLQVEHPVTELVTGLDLVALQLAVAAGRAAAPGGAHRHASPATRSRRGSTPRTSARGFLPSSGRLAPVP